VRSRSVRAPRALERRLPIGAEVVPGGVHFRVWAPRRQQVEVVREDGRSAEPLEAEGNGYFAGLVGGAAAGTRYRFRLDGHVTVPDPVSRFQPEGPHGPSEVIDPSGFRWTDSSRRGVGLERPVIYELHVGTFTPEGTWTAASALLSSLADLGVTLIEVMPVGDFPGRFGWGYDGVNLFAPTRLYGRPDSFRAFVDRAHAVGLGVLLDVVYNHFGPSGNYLREYATDYFTSRYTTPWGESLHFDGEGSGPVREFFLANVSHWMEEYHIDGLRLDATHTIMDASGEHILAAVSQRVRACAAKHPSLVIAEDEPQRTLVLAPSAQGGWGVDGLWHDDFHHSARVAATGRSEGYFARCTGTAAELASLAARSAAEGGRRYAAFINFLQNHDQVSVSPGSRRLHQLTSPGRWRALTALLLLGPGSPMLFQGDEFAATSPFPYFADHEPDLAPLVREGRAKHLAQFRSTADPAAQALLHDPGDPETFRCAKLDAAERARHAAAVRLHRDLLGLRRSGDGLDGATQVEPAVLSSAAFALRATRDPGGRSGLLLVNLGCDLELPDTLRELAPPRGSRWSLRWSSDDVAYLGPGIPEAARTGALLPAESALLFLADRQGA
jgi:maltooligosyltrehalose trehalohydrolase